MAIRRCTDVTLSQNVLDRSSPNFQNMYIYRWTWSFRPFRNRSRDIATVTDFWHKSVKIGIARLHSVPCVGIPQRIRGSQHAARVIRPMTPLRLIKSWWTLSSNPWVLQTHCAGRGTRWALSCISSFVCGTLCCCKIYRILWVMITSEMGIC